MGGAMAISTMVVGKIASADMDGWLRKDGTWDGK